jgi:hypothetical protein
MGLVLLCVCREQKGEKKGYFCKFAVVSGKEKIPVKVTTFSFFFFNLVILVASFERLDKC